MNRDILTRQELEDHELLESLIDTHMYRIHTSLIAQVVTFNEGSNTVDVQPVIMQKMIGRDPERLPIIKNCPIKYYGAGGYVITFKPQPGDLCDLAINERSMDVWKKTGGIVDSGMPRHHNLTDAKAYFGINDYGNSYDSLKAGMDIRTRDGLTSFHIQDGVITLTVGGTQVATFSASGVQFGVPVVGPSGTFGGKTVETHTHSGVQSGSSNSGPPT